MGIPYTERRFVMSSESHKMSQKPLDEMTLKEFVDSIDAMGFDGQEVPEDV